MTKRLSSALIAALCLTCTNGDPESDCRAVCDARRNCIDTTTVSHDCENACDQRAATDGDYKQRVKDCHACLNTRTCEDFLVLCDTICAGVPD